VPTTEEMILAKQTHREETSDANVILAEQSHRWMDVGNDTRPVGKRAVEEILQPVQ
jgi:hypothetical protein